MANKKTKTYMDKLMEDKEFKKTFEHEYSKLIVSEQIVKLRKTANLTQEALAKKIHSTKSAVSRYESAAYSGYSMSLLRKIANACGSELQIKFVKNKRKPTQTARV